MIFSQLVIMTPKSLLRHPDAKSPISDMVEGTQYVFMCVCEVVSMSVLVCLCEVYPVLVWCTLCLGVYVCLCFGVHVCVRCTLCFICCCVNTSTFRNM